MACGQNCGHSGFKIVENKSHWEPEHCKALFIQPKITLLVTLWPVSAIMCFSIDFDGELYSEARKIQHIRPDWMLSAEFVTTGALAQFSPQTNFGGISAAPFSLCCLERSWSCGQYPSTPPACAGAVPLPETGRLGR